MKVFKTIRNKRYTTVMILSLIIDLSSSITEPVENDPGHETTEVIL